MTKQQLFVILNNNNFDFSQVTTIMRCGAECAERNCGEFSFHPLPPDGGTCNMIMTKNGTYQPLEGAEYYTKP